MFIDRPKDIAEAMRFANALSADEVQWLRLAYRGAVDIQPPRTLDKSYYQWFNEKHVLSDKGRSIIAYTYEMPHTPLFTAIKTEYMLSFARPRELSEKQEFVILYDGMKVPNLPLNELEQLIAGEGHLWNIIRGRLSVYHEALGCVNLVDPHLNARLGNMQLAIRYIKPPVIVG